VSATRTFSELPLSPAARLSVPACHFNHEHHHHMKKISIGKILGAAALAVLLSVSAPLCRAQFYRTVLADPSGRVVAPSNFAAMLPTVPAASNAATANRLNGTLALTNLPASVVTNNQPYVQFGEVDDTAGDYMFAGTIQDLAGDYLNDGRIQDAAGDYMYDGGFSTSSGDFRVVDGVVTTGTNIAVAFNGGTFSGNGSGLTFTNAAGAAFRMVVNASTNGFIFVSP